MIGQFDSDGSGSLDRQEFLALMMNKGLSLGMEERAMIMAGPETRPLMARLQQHGLFLSEEQILKYREVFQILDADHSGEMDSSGENFLKYQVQLFFLKIRNTDKGK